MKSRQYRLHTNSSGPEISLSKNGAV